MSEGGRRVPRAVGEPASNLGPANPSPRPGQRSEAPSPLGTQHSCPHLYPGGDPSSSNPTTPHPTSRPGAGSHSPSVTPADPQPPRGTNGAASGLNAKLVGFPFPPPGARGCPQPPGPAPAPPPQAPREGAGTLRRGGMNQTLRG